MMPVITCAYCGKDAEKSLGDYNRATKLGAKLFCSLKCCGLNRRTNETEEEKKDVKTWYDLFIRASMTEEEKIIESINNALWFQLDYKANPAKYKKWRQKRMPKHIEYCRQPSYKAKKHQYDIKRNHKSKYGAFWEASIVLLQLEKELDKRVAKGELKLITKSQKRKRKWQKLQKQLTLNSLLRT